MRNKTEFCCKTEFCRNKKSMSAEKNPELCVLYMLGDITAGPAYRFAQWLELVRKRSGKYRASGFPHRPYRLETMPSRSAISLSLPLFISN
ncbi:hypothetical protein OIU77_007440 [Salix suchowensis]|uniref:Uncharacterized protein n=1 Tax=Salix suchowensis TaxID=1278906 RepID=A0ABQ9AGA2_9ROSI|nr:hypothetical protein OIU77_007440 [Salix suchowensis]